MTLNEAIKKATDNQNAAAEAQFVQKVQSLLNSIQAHRQQIAQSERTIADYTKQLKELKFEPVAPLEV